ncbi:alpha/beta hydrolase [Zhenhengia sp.]|uniref:alpha/beta hydrolase n=1 Tax=Zhenhengia sp. TaxID=2944208 RepID=UPI003994E26F
MNLMEQYFYGKDGVKLFCRKDIPSKCKCIVVIAHGFMEHSGRYIDFAKILIAQNIGVCIIDHRGNGFSEGPKGDIEDFFDFVEDLHYLIQDLKSRYKKPIVTYGHSMGGLITFIYGLKYKEDLMGQILASPALGVPIGMKNLPPAFYESLGFMAGDLKIHRVGEGLATRNEVYIEAFKEDKVGNTFATMRFMDQFLRIGVEYAIEHAKEYAVPSLFLLGTKDLVIPISRNRSLVRKIPFEDKQIIEYESCMHDLLHDLDTEIQKIQEDILTWIEKLIKKHTKTN